MLVTAITWPAGNLSGVPKPDKISCMNTCKNLRATTSIYKTPVFCQCSMSDAWKRVNGRYKRLFQVSSRNEEKNHNKVPHLVKITPINEIVIIG